MILEGLVTSQDASGTLNIAPMGPIVDESMSRLVLRPFQTSRTYRNLKEQPSGVFHVVDDVLLLAQAAIGRIESEPPTLPTVNVIGRVLADACRWYEFEVEELDDSTERTNIQVRVVHVGRLRDYFGLNRAKHAVVEAAILATRLHLIPPQEIHQQMEWLRAPVQKTAGPREVAAFALIEKFINSQLEDRS